MNLYLGNGFGAKLSIASFAVAETLSVNPMVNPTILVTNSSSQIPLSHQRQCSVNKHGAHQFTVKRNSPKHLR